MSDVHDHKVRSYNMSQIRAKNTKPELIVRKFLHSNGYRYRLHDKKLPGNPDLVLKKYNTVIFIHGCFFHGHEGCRYFKVPRTNTKWWKQKIEKNKARDEENEQKLNQLGWKILIIWECELTKTNMDNTLQNLIINLNKNSYVKSN